MAKETPIEYRKLWQQYANAGIDPGTIAGFGEQRQGLFTQYRDSMSLLKSSIKDAQRATRRQIRDVRRQGQVDLATAAAAAAERGVLGSSSDVTQRMNVQSATASGVMAAREALMQAVNNIHAQRIQAGREFYSGLANIQAQQVAAKALAGISTFGEGLLDAWVQTNAGGGGGGGVRAGDGRPAAFGPPPKNLTQAVNRADSFRELLTNLQSLGFRIGETGVKGFDPVGGGHAPGGAHYARPKRVADINFGPGGASALERRKLAQLYQALQAAGIPIRQVLYPGNEPRGHGDHMHLEVLVKRWYDEQRRKRNRAGSPRNQVG